VTVRARSTPGSRSSTHTGITPAMCMRLTGIGSQYLIAMHGGDGEFLDGNRNYRITLAPNIPESRFWSVILCGNQTRSMLQTDQPCPASGAGRAQ
jgi:hypothetical protein